MELLRARSFAWDVQFSCWGGKKKEGWKLHSCQQPPGAAELLMEALLSSTQTCVETFKGSI